MDKLLCSVGFATHEKIQDKKGFDRLQDDEFWIVPFWFTPCQVLELRGDSFEHFGNAAIVQSIVDRLPEIAKEIAKPLSKTDKVRTNPRLSLR